MLGFGPGRSKTLVSMATDSSHRVLMGENVVNTHAPSFSIGYSSFQYITRPTRKISNEFKIRQIRLRTADVAALEPLKTSP